MSENFYTANASLAGVEHLGADEMQTIWRVEMAGEHFYNLLAERIDDPEAKDLLRRNAVRSEEHTSEL